jgi:starch synthase (maltosyl-transferring)
MANHHRRPSSVNQASAVASQDAPASRDREAVVDAPQPVADPPDAQSRRVIIDRVRPCVDDGRFPVKRTMGESIEIVAKIFADGHDVIAAAVKDRALSDADGPWRETPLTLAAPGTDQWTAQFDLPSIGWHKYAVIAWIDRFGTWRRDLAIKVAAAQDVGVEMLEGALRVRAAAARADAAGSGADDANWLLTQADALSDASPIADRVVTALGEELARLMRVYDDRAPVTSSKLLRVRVDRERARFGAWYEMFPRSAGADTGRGGTFQDACALLAGIADLGFDVLYLPPIHPIGRSFRKGPNNTLTAGPDDPGSPWAIGSSDGGHTAIDPGLGTLDDFASFRRTAKRQGLEIALDLAFQCSPDHPWVREHPEWFRHRPDGTIKYAENPPKKYQDIYPFDFACEEWRSLWRALLDVTLFWVGQGIRIFRVDNPHTKSLGFWEWAIAEVQTRHPDVIFLAEAFTRPAVMQYLAKAGFTQSYSYFTWRNTKVELTEYLTELTASPPREYLRPNLFANTPDILHAYLQTGGRAAFQARLLLAATLGASYGIYGGFELCEAQAVPGTEEYFESEKYQVKHRDWDRPGHIKELIARVNRIRRHHRALQFDWTLQFHETDNPEIIAYSKTSPDGADALLTIVNLDPHHMQHGHVDVRVPGSGFFTAHDLLDDATYAWRDGWNYVRFDPDIRQGHILKLESAS